MRRRKKTGRPKLKGKTREMASKFIAEEMRTRRYKPEQAQAIGISRAKKATEREEDRKTICELMHKFA